MNSGRGVFGGKPGMPRSRRVTALICVLALAGASYLAETSSADARHARHRSAYKHKKAKSKASEVAKQETVAPIPTTPADKDECIRLSQVFYGQAKTLSRRTKQSIPREFERVIGNLDQFCGEEEFDKARVAIDWMSTCLQNFNKDYQIGGFCSRDKSYFCAVDPRSDGCLQARSEAR
jgi:hypothetical protein